MASYTKSRTSTLESSRRLISWKSIASHLGCDERTAKRWERERNMPVHRAPGGKRSAVFAYAEELDQWLNAGRVPSAAASQPVTPMEADSQTALGGPMSRRGAILLLASAAIVLVIAGFFVEGRHRPPAKSEGRMVSRSATHPRPAGAEQLFLRGRYYWNLRTADSLNKAIDAYSQAIALDPSYAAAYAGMAETYDLLPQFAGTDLGESLEKAKAAADRAIALNPNIASAHRAKAFALFFWDWDIAASDAEFQRALALDPDSPETHQWYASTLDGRLEGAECLKQINEARRLNPTSAAIATDAALFEVDFGDFDAGVKALKEMEQTQPTLATPSVFLWEIDFARGDFPAYIGDLRRTAAVTHSPVDEALAAAVARGWARGGTKGLLEAKLSVLKAAFDQGKDPGLTTAETLVLLGRTKEALPYFRAALKNRSMPVMTLPDCDWGKELAKDPEYAALFADIRAQMRGGYPEHLPVMPLVFRLPPVRWGTGVDAR